MIDQYNKTALAHFFDYNNELIEQWADNVYEKIRQSGELANYVKRDKIVRQRFDAYNNSPSATVPAYNSEFTFGRSYFGELLTLENNQIENLGRIYQVEFELMFEESGFSTITMFDDYVTISNTNIITVGSVSFSGFSFQVGFLHKIKIVRSYYEVSLFLDGEEIGRDVLAQDEDTSYNILYQIGSASTRIYNPDQYSDQYS